MELAFNRSKKLLDGLGWSFENHFLVQEYLLRVSSATFDFMVFKFER